MSSDEKATALLAAIEAAQSALADYEAQITPVAPALGLDVVVTTGRGAEVRPNDDAPSKPATGSAAQQARDAVLRRHGRTRTGATETPDERTAGLRRESRAATRQVAVEEGSAGTADARARARADYERRHPQRAAR